MVTNKQPKINHLACKKKIFKNVATFSPLIKKVEWNERKKTLGQRSMMMNIIIHHMCVYGIEEVIIKLVTHRHFYILIFIVRNRTNVCVVVVVIIIIIIIMVMIGTSDQHQQ